MPTLGATALLTLASACGAGAEGQPSAPSGHASAPIVTPAIAPGEGDRFVDVTAAAGIDFVHRLLDGHRSSIVESLGSGAAGLDYEGDGRLDLAVTDGERWVVYSSPDETSRAVIRIHRGAGAPEELALPRGLAHGFVFGAAPDAGRVWAATERGLSRGSLRPIETPTEEQKR